MRSLGELDEGVESPVTDLSDASKWSQVVLSLASGSDTPCPSSFGGGAGTIAAPMSTSSSGIDTLPKPTLSGSLGRNLSITAALLFVVCLVALVPPVFEARDLQTQTQAMAQQLDAARQQIRELEAQRATVATELAASEQSLATKRASLATVERDLSVAREGLEEAKKVKADADAAVRAARDAATTEAKGIVDRATAEAELSEKKRKAAEERVALLEASERTLNAAIASAEPQAAAAQRRLEETRKMEAELIAAVSTLQQQYSDLTKQTESALTLRGEVQTLSAEKAALGKQIAEAKSSLAEAQGKAESIRVDETRAAYLRNEIQQQQTKLAGLQVAIGAAEERSAAVSRVQVDIDSLTERKTQLETVLAGLRVEEARLAGTEATRLEVEGKLSQLRTELGALEQRVAAAKSEAQAADAVRGQKSVLDTEVARLRAEVAQLEERSAALVRSNAQVEAAAQSAEKLKASYEALTKVLTDIQTRLNAPPPKVEVKPEVKQDGQTGGGQ